MSLVIIKNDGTIYDLKKLGIRTTEFDIQSPTYMNILEQADGRSGFIDIETYLEGRILRASFFIQSVDAPDFDLLRNEVFKIFDSKESFYLIHLGEPGKRWRVKCNNSFSIAKKHKRYGQFTVEFISPSPYSESIGDTLTPLTFDAESWQIGQGLISEETNYIHNTSSFSIFNAGDVDLDPREFPLSIKYTGASSDLKIENLTSGDNWQYTGTTLGSDTLEIDGVRSLKNGISVLSNTNKKLIKLNRGWNEFILTGVSGTYEISFDFRFYYL